MNIVNNKFVPRLLVTSKINDSFSWYFSQNLINLKISHSWFDSKIFLKINLYLIIAV